MWNGGRQRLNRVKTSEDRWIFLYRKKEIQVLLIFNAKVTRSKIVDETRKQYLYGGSNIYKFISNSIQKIPLYKIPSNIYYL